MLLVSNNKDNVMKNITYWEYFHFEHYHIFSRIFSQHCFFYEKKVSLNHSFCTMFVQTLYKVCTMIVQGNKKALITID